MQIIDVLKCCAFSVREHSTMDCFKELSQQ